MQVRHFFFLTILAFSLFQVPRASAQKITVNENGEKIMVYPDGSWHYYYEDDMKSDPSPDDPGVLKMEEDPGLTDPQPEVDPTAEKKNDDIEAEVLNRKKAIQRAERAAKEETRMRGLKESATQHRKAVEDELERAYHNVDMTNEDIVDIEQKLNLAKDKEFVAKANYKSAREYTRQMERMIAMPEAKRAKLLEKMKAEEEAFSSVEANTRQEEERSVVASQRSPGNRSVYGRPPIKKESPKENVLLYPPDSPCQLAYENVDEFSKKKRKETQKMQFFAHTPERFQPYFKERDYLVCQGSAVAVSGVPRFVNIEFTIATEQAAREFGVLEKGSQFIVRLLDGNRVILLNNKTATGLPDPGTKTTHYSAQYLLNKQQIKMLRHAEVDKVRVIWATGYEDYEVYQVDFFKDLLECLKD